MNLMLDHQYKYIDLPMTQTDPETVILSDMSGVSSDDIMKLQRAWVRMRDEDECTILAIKQEVAEMFGMPLADFTVDRIAALSDESPAISRGDIKAVVSAIYARTQEQLIADGIPNIIPLYRGTQRDMLVGLQRINSSVLSSWAADPACAKPFAYNGSILEIHIPRSRIFSTSCIGFGDDGESEVVIIGDTFGVGDEVISTPQIGEKTINIEDIEYDWLMAKNGIDDVSNFVS